MKWLVLAALTLYGFFVFPGHTFLQSDTQIYMPMFDRIADPSLFTKELVAQRQHVSLTLYDEVAISAKKFAGLSYEQSLGAIQLACRFAGLYGLYLMGLALGLTEMTALLVPVLAGFGAFVIGPAVITFEYEPVPRGFAVLLTFLAMGFAMQGRAVGAAIAVGLAFLFHAPATVPFLIPFVWVEWREKQYRALAIIGGAIGVAVLFAMLQSGSVEPQRLFSTIDPEWEKLQRMRAAYNWLSSWKPWFFRDFLLHAVIASVAMWRLWQQTSVRVRTLVLSMTWIGILSLPLAWLVTEEWKWLLMSQVQPARSVLFTVELSLVLSAAAGLYAMQRARYWEAPLWLFPPLFTAVNRFLANDTAYQANRFYTAGALIAVTTLVAFAAVLPKPRWRWAVAVAGPVAVAVLTGWLCMTVIQQKNYEHIHHAELDQAAEWARNNTPREAIFQLPEFSRSLVSGIFRVRAQRALFVDWKIGGQVNYSRDLAMEWWRRMQIADRKDKPLESWREEGVDYLVLKKDTRLDQRPPLYTNAKYAVYALQP